MVVTALVSVATFAGCVPRDGRAYPNATDLSRAQKVWADPWLAAEGTTLAGPNGTGLSRDVAGRSYTTAAEPRAVALAEVRAATSAGWALVSVSCDPDEPGEPGSVAASLGRGTGGDAALVTLEAALSSASGTVVELSAEVPHHLDPGWPASTSLDLASTCLVTGSPTSSAPPSGAPTPSNLDLEDGSLDPPEWSDAGEDGLSTAVAAVADDPVLRELGLTITTPPETGATEARDAAVGRSDEVTTTDGLAAVVARLRAQGWTLTYAGCIGSGAPDIAELTRPAGKRHATLRLSEVPGAAEPRLAATVAVSTPGLQSQSPTRDQ
ncbi:hypothetical protein BCF74_12053 [Knoellia remsis]|uniref:Uncharacterized protein n=2 Tax=Knoellia remsis TaxID=407159 RepID=A0A2T0UDV4_9MICO|nr:hypothetical protein BCF74_12053 [Knoellia remsis]